MRENTQRKFKCFGLIRSNIESVAAACRRRLYIQQVFFGRPRLLSNPDMDLQKTQKENVKYAGFMT